MFLSQQIKLAANFIPKKFGCQSKNIFSTPAQSSQLVFQPKYGAQTFCSSLCITLYFTWTISKSFISSCLLELLHLNYISLNYFPGTPSLKLLYFHYFSEVSKQLKLSMLTKTKKKQSKQKIGGKFHEGEGCQQRTIFH